MTGREAALRPSSPYGSQATNHFQPCAAVPVLIHSLTELLNSRLITQVQKDDQHLRELANKEASNTVRQVHCKFLLSINNFPFFLIFLHHVRHGVDLRAPHRYQKFRRPLSSVSIPCITVGSDTLTLPGPSIRALTSTFQPQTRTLLT